KRARLRGRRRYRRAGSGERNRALLPAARRAMGRDPRALDPARGRGLRLLPRRRLRAGDELRPDRRVRERAVRPAGDRPRHHPRRRRNAAADPSRGQSAGDGHDPQRAAALGARGARGRARRPRRGQGSLARRGEARRGRQRREGAGYRSYATRFDTDDLVYRLLTLLGMFAVAALASAVPDALHGGQRRFVLAYVVVRVILIRLYVRAYPHVEAARRLAGWFIFMFSTAVVLW